MVEVGGELRERGEVASSRVRAAHPVMRRDLAGVLGIRAAGEGQPPRDGDREREGALATRTRRKAERPPRYKVLLYNDNYTPMEFVVQILEKIFQKSPSAATQLMLEIHRTGLGVAGVYLLEIAETKMVNVHRLAEERGYPLRAGIEKE